MSSTANGPRSLYLSIAGHEVHVTEWGDRDAPALVMWHGLARVGRDFDTIARQLAPMFHIICPDTIGRGLSSWSKDPQADYTIPAYCGHAIEMLDRLGLEQVRWVGTSMGGIIGMALAGTKETAGRIERLVINDVGPEINQAAVDRIKAYVTMVPEFPSIAHFEAFLRIAYAPFGKMTDAEWRLMTETSLRRRDNGTYSSHYDPAVMTVFAEHMDEFDMWDIYDAITCPTLLVRGETSDLLLAESAVKMTQRGPCPALITIPGCGHAPALNTQDQVAVLKGFLA
ncbi:MAG: alpha/beta hydrolase [Rhodospirillaceae bacterium]|nr:alpha/beta hydrolase [Rhodospirillales bacterium]